MAAWRAKREGLDPEQAYDLAFYLVIGGVVGARGSFVVQHHEVIRGFWDIFKNWQGGIVLYGSLIGAVAGFGLAWWRMRFPFRPMLDAIAPAIALGIAFGRVGCFLNGCCYGDVCHLPWAVQFPAHTLPSAHRVAEGLIPKTAGALAAGRSDPTVLGGRWADLAGAAVGVLPLRRRDGAVMALLLTTYPITRFLIEWLRDDEAAFVAGLTISQAISILVFLGGLGFWYALSRLPRGRWADSVVQPRASPPNPPREFARDFPEPSLIGTINRAADSDGTGASPMTSPPRRKRNSTSRPSAAR